MEQGSNRELVINNFIIHKILPKMTFDGNKKISESENKKDLFLKFRKDLEKHINKKLTKQYGINASEELSRIIKVSESNDGIVNYWA